MKYIFYLIICFSVYKVSAQKYSRLYNHKWECVKATDSNSATTKETIEEHIIGRVYHFKSDSTFELDLYVTQNGPLVKIAGVYYIDKNGYLNYPKCKTIIEGGKKSDINCIVNGENTCFTPHRIKTISKNKLVIVVPKHPKSKSGIMTLIFKRVTN